jgi:hypothetical protein
VTVETPAPALFWHPDGHPRDRFPDLVGILTEADYAMWQLYGECLCGCGGITKLRRPEQRGSTQISYWCSGHLQALRSRHGLVQGRDRSATQREAASRYNIAQCVTPVQQKFILASVREYIDAHHGGSITRFARAIKDDHSTLCYNFAGKSRLSKRRAAKLLKAIGEQPHPSLLV